MGLLDSVLGSFLGNNPGASPLQSVLGSVLGGGGGQQPGVGGLVSRFEQAGLGQVVGSWVGNGQNQPVSPGQLQQVFGNDQVQHWAQQSGLPVGTMLGQLAQFLPQLVDHATPGGQIPQYGGAERSPFDDAGTELPVSRRV